MAGHLLPQPCCGWCFQHRYSWLQHTSSHTFPLSPNHLGTSRIYPFCVGNQDLHTEDTEPAIFICFEAYQGNVICNRNVREGTPPKCFSFLLKIRLKSAFALLDLLIFIKVKLDIARQAEARRKKSVPAAPYSILVPSSYVAHLFLLFQNKLKLTSIFFSKFLFPAVIARIIVRLFFYFLSPCLHSRGQTHLRLPSLDTSCHA